MLADLRLKGPGAALLLAAFLASGFSALTYELVWMRLLIYVFGVTYYAIATTVTVFMGGLALGALLAGRLIDRGHDPIRAYVVLEIALAIMGAAVPFTLPLLEGLYVTLHGALDPGLGGRIMIQFALCAAVLLPPTAAMGATLPVLSRYVITRPAEVRLGVGLLHGVNTIGAMLGCGVTGFYLIWAAGLLPANMIAVALNLAAAALAALAGRSAPALPPAERAGPGPAFGSRWWLVAFFFSGAISMSVELLLTRIAANLFNNPHTLVFALVLGCWLAGLGLGSLLITRVARGIAPRVLYGALQMCAGALVVASPLLLGAIQAGGGVGAGSVVERWGLAFHSADITWIMLVAGGVSLIFGMLFPPASALYLRRMPRLGATVGAVSFTITLGGIAGSFFTGFWLMPLLSAKDALLAMGAGCLILGSLVLAPALAPGPRVRAALAGLAVTASVGAAAWISVTLPDHAFLPRYVETERVLFHRDGRSTSDAVVITPASPQPMLIPNGEIPLRGEDMATYLPLHLHPSPRRMLLIAFATGFNSHMALRDPALEHLTCCDLSDNQLLMAPLFKHENGEVYDDPRFRFEANDGRNFLVTNREPFDVIYNDAAFFATYLHMFTREFLALTRANLRPGGLYVTKLHLHLVGEAAMRRLLSTFLEVFPRASIWRVKEPRRGRIAHAELLLLVGRAGGGPVSLEHLDRELARRGAAKAFGLDRCGLINRYLVDGDELARATGQGVLIEDLRPMRFSQLFRRHPYEFSEEEFTRWRGEHPWATAEPGDPARWISGVDSEVLRACHQR